MTPEMRAQLVRAGETGRAEAHERDARRPVLSVVKRMSNNEIEESIVDWLHRNGQVPEGSVPVLHFLIPHSVTLRLESCQADDLVEVEVLL